MTRSESKLNMPRWIELLKKRSFYLAFWIILFVLIIDTLIVKIYRFTSEQPSSQFNHALFFVIVLVYFLGQYLVTRFVMSKMPGEFSPALQDKVKLFLRILPLFQYALGIFLLIIFFQMILDSSYDSFLLKAVIWLSYLQAALIIGFLVYRFFSWSRAFRSHVVMLYAIAFSVLFSNVIFTILYVNDQLDTYSGYVSGRGGSSETFLPSLTQRTTLAQVFQVSSVISYMMVWVSTTLLFRGHSKKSRPLLYWIVVCIPLLYFIIQFQPIFIELFSTYRIEDPITFAIVYTLFLGVSKPIGGILFGIVLWLAGQRIQNEYVRHFMIIAAFGMILFFTSNQAVILVAAPYPPFGLVSISFIGLAAYLLFIGFYFSAISVAQNYHLRSSIKKSAGEESRLIGSIGNAQLEEELKRKVLYLVKRQQESMIEEAGVQSSFTDEEIKEYVEQAIEEIKNRKQNKGML
jgi:hypothetical protein